MIVSSSHDKHNWYLEAHTTKYFKKIFIYLFLQINICPPISAQSWSGQRRPCSWNLHRADSNGCRRPEGSKENLIMF